MEINDEISKKVKATYEKYPYPLYQHITPVVAKGIERILKFINVPIGEIKTVIDCGCGTGSNLVASAKHFSNIQFYGFDITENTLKKANEYIKREKLNNARTFQANLMEEIPLVNNEKYDAAYCTGVINHVADPLQVLKNIKKTLKPGAPLIIVCYGDYGWVHHKQLISLVNQLYSGDDIEEYYKILKEFPEFINKIYEPAPVTFSNPGQNEYQKISKERIATLLRMPLKVILRKLMNEFTPRKINLDSEQMKANLIDLLLNPQILTFNNNSIKKIVKEAGFEFLTYIDCVPSPREYLKSQILIEKVEKLDYEEQLNFAEKYLQINSYMFGVRISTNN